MADYISNIASEPANQAMASGDFYKPTRYEWLGAAGTQQYRFPPTFRPDFGHGDVWDMDWTNDGGSEANIESQWVTRREAPWKVPTSITSDKYGFINDEHGFYIKKPSTTAAREIPVIIEGGVGHWMPAPIYRNIAWYWKNETAVNANWIVRTPGLVLRNWRTNEEKTYSIGWNTRQGVANANGTSYIVTGQAKSDPVNALGPDWFIYGVMFHMRSKGTSGNQSPKGELLDVVLAWHNPDTGPGATKLIIPDKMSWDDFRAMKQRNEVSYYELPPRKDIGIIAEWNWRGHTSGNDHEMCDSDKYGTASYSTSNYASYMSDVDRYGFDPKRVLERNDAWFKLNDNPAYFRAKGYPYGPAVCGWPIQNVDFGAGRTEPGGILRAYVSNPDA